MLCTRAEALAYTFDYVKFSAFPTSGGRGNIPGRIGRREKNGPTRPRRMSPKVLRSSRWKPASDEADHLFGFFFGFFSLLQPQVLHIVALLLITSSKGSPRDAPRPRKPS